LKVLVHCREDALIKSGGDYLSIKDKENILKTYGVSLKYESNPFISLKEYDLVHIHQPITNFYDIYNQYLNAVKWKKPIVMKPFYNPIIDINYYRKHTSDRNIRILSKIFNNYFSYIKYRNILYSIINKDIKKAIKQYPMMPIKLMRKIIKGSFCIPDSNFELKSLSSELNIPIKNYKVVNASLNVNKSLADVSKEKFLSKFGISNFTLCVGRIEPIKNQINLLRALIGTKLNVVIIGPLQSKHPHYGSEFLKLINNNNNFYWISDMNREMLMSAFKNAKVVVLPSWTETAGMTGIEGMFFGCNIVATNRGACSEYFGDNALYFDPKKLLSIKQNVIKSNQIKQNHKKLKNYIIKKFSLEKTARDLCSAYELAIN